MPIVNRTVADGYTYGIVDREIPMAGPDGLPTGEMLATKVVAIHDGSSTIEIVFVNTPENPDWDLFVDRVNGARVTIASEADLARLPTIEQITRPLGRNGHA